MNEHQSSTPLLSRIKRLSVKDLALEQLKHYILSRSIDPGQRLPSERELAELLGIGRNSVREALKALEALGLVESRVGEGTFIVAQAGTSIGRAIGFSLAVWGGTMIEIFEARQMIEVGAARAAAEHATDEDLKNLLREVEAMEASKAFNNYLQADLNFHRSIGQATHNAIIAHIITDLIDMLEAVLKEIHIEQLSSLSEGKGTHRSIFEAIAQHNPIAVTVIMREHLQFSTELWQAVTSLGSVGKMPGDK